MKIRNRNRDDSKHQLKQLEKKYDTLKEQNEILVTDYLNLASGLGGAIDLVEQTLKLSKDLKTPQEVMEKRAGENKDANTTLNDWLRGPKRVLENKLRLYEHQSQIFEGLVFSILTNAFIHQNTIARNNPVAFYDYLNERFYHNNRATKLLKMQSGESYDSLVQLLEKIRNDRITLKNGEKQKSISKRKYLVQILKQGKSLTGFEIQVPYKKDDFRKLYLTTRPIDYVSRRGNVKCKKAFGILILFDEHKRIEKEYVEVEGILKGLEHEFKTIYEAVEKIPFSF